MKTSFGSIPRSFWFRVLAGAVVCAVFGSAAAIACSMPMKEVCELIPVPDEPDIVLEDRGNGNITLVVRNYETFGSVKGESCGCALKFASVFDTIDSVDIFDATTGQPLKAWDPDTSQIVEAFDFQPNSNTGSGFEGVDSGTWNGFSATSAGDITPNIPIQLVFKGKLASGKTIDDVINDLSAAGNVVGTDEVNPDGTLSGGHTTLVESCRFLTAPLCRIVSLTSSTVDLEFVDADDGLQSIVVTSAYNVDSTIPPFTPGTMSPVPVDAEKTDPYSPGYIYFRACDTLGACIRCDPVAADLVLADKGRLEETFVEIPGEDRYLLVENGGPGVRRVEVDINGRMIHNIAGLKDGERYHFDIGRGLDSGADNVVTVTASGSPGGSVFIALGDIPLGEMSVPDTGRVRVRSTLGLKSPHGE